MCLNDEMGGNKLLKINLHISLIYQGIYKLLRLLKAKQIFIHEIELKSFFKPSGPVLGFFVDRCWELSVVCGKRTGATYQVLNF